MTESVVVSTGDVGLPDRVEYWRSRVAESLLPLDVGRSGMTLDARLAVIRLGHLTIGDVSSSASPVVRTVANIARREGGGYKIGLQVRGRSTLRQNGREATLGPGDLALYDLDRPYSIEYHDASHVLIFMFPRERLRLRRQVVTELTGMPISGQTPVGALATTFLTRLVPHLESTSVTSALLFADSMIDLMTGLLAEHAGGRYMIETPSQQHALLLRAEAYIASQLADPGLDTAAVAAAVHISPRTLQRLFAAEGLTVAGVIRRRRLERCRAELADPGLRGRSVSAIAAAAGLPDAAHFSRAFKLSYGMSPHEYRATQRPVQVRPARPTYGVGTVQGSSLTETGDLVP